MKSRIVEIVNKNYSNPQFDINRLAKELKISRVYLNTRCNFDIGNSPHDYLEKIRIENAMIALLDGNKIIEVCKQVGYSNKKTFYLAFKKETGVTPNEFVIKNKM